MTTMTLTATEVLEFSRAATAMYARGENDLGHLLSAVAAAGTVAIAQYDRASSAYRLTVARQAAAPTETEEVQ